MRATAIIAVSVLLQGCYGIRVSVHAPPSPPYRAIARAHISSDDLDTSRLTLGAQASMRYYAAARKPSAAYSLGDDVYDFNQLSDSVRKFVDIVEQTHPSQLDKRLARECKAYAPRAGLGDHRFTGYYEPVLRAKLEPDENFRFPIYQQPDDLTLVRLFRFFPNDGRRFHGYLRGKELLPYLTRADIDGRGLLRDRGLELAWVDDPVALYFLHIQGSGRLHLDGGDVLRVNFAASNGMPYNSVGRYMLDEGILGPTGGSSPAIKAFLTQNPEMREEILFKNPRYIFFRSVDLAKEEGPVGSLGVPLVAGRSLATDHAYVPPGAVVYVRSDKPVLDERGKLLRWERFGRFMFNHDSGAAIKGPGRADIYWGEGERSGYVAGFMNRPGSMTVLMCGVEPSFGYMAKSKGAVGYRTVNWPAGGVGESVAVAATRL